MGHPLFSAVAQLLQGIASLTGLTYNEINIIAYYILLPFVYVALLDRIIGKHVLKIAYVSVWIVLLIRVGNFAAFCDDLFELSVRFLRTFSVVGLDYVGASVLVCVVLPALVFAMLTVIAFPSLRMKTMAFFGKHPRPGNSAGKP